MAEPWRSARCILGMFFRDSVPVAMTQVFLHRGACPLPNVAVPTAKCREERAGRERHSVPTPATLCALATYPAFCQRLLHPEQRPQRTTKSATDLCYGHKLLMDTAAALGQPRPLAAASAARRAALVLPLSEGREPRCQPCTDLQWT